MPETVICAPVRTAVGRYGGVFKDVPAAAGVPVEASTTSMAPVWTCITAQITACRSEPHRRSSWTPVSAGWEARMDRIPGVGDDTRAILMALGRDDGEIGRLILDGVVSEPASTEG